MSARFTIVTNEFFQVFRRITGERRQHVGPDLTCSGPSFGIARTGNPDGKLRLYRLRQDAYFDRTFVHALERHGLACPQLLNHLDVTEHHFLALLVSIWREQEV